MDLLEGDSLQSQGVSSTCDEWTQVMAVETEVVFVRLGFGLVATCVHEHLERLEFLGFDHRFTEISFSE